MILVELSAAASALLWTADIQRLHAPKSIEAGEKIRAKVVSSLTRRSDSTSVCDLAKPSNVRHLYFPQLQACRDQPGSRVLAVQTSTTASGHGGLAVGLDLRHDLRADLLAVALSSTDQVCLGCLPMGVRSFLLTELRPKLAPSTRHARSGGRTDSQVKSDK